MQIQTLQKFPCFLLYLFISLQHQEIDCSTGLRDAVGLDEAEYKHKLEGTKYSIYRKSLPWAESQIYCEQREGNLATFVNVEDLQKVIDMIYELSAKPIEPAYLSGAHAEEFGLDRRYWIGLSDLVTGEGKWTWTEKGLPLTYDNMWYPGQPDHVDKDGNYLGRPEHCVGLWNPIFHKMQKHSLDDLECKKAFYFICEEDTNKLSAQQAYRSKYGEGEPVKQGRGIVGKLSPKGLRSKTKHQTTKSAKKGRGIPKGKTVKTTPSPPIVGDKLAKKLKAVPQFKELFENSREKEDAKRAKQKPPANKKVVNKEAEDVFLNGE